MFRDLRDIRARVVPQQAEAVQAPRRPVSRLSAQAAKVVGQTAGTISDPGLRAALERLSRSADIPHETKRRS